MANLRMPSTNYLIIAGRLTREPESRDVGGVQFCEIGIANTRHFKGSNGEKKEETLFAQVKCWRTTAEIASRLKKGEAVLIQGRLAEDKWKDRDGKDISKTRIVAERIDSLQWPDDNAQPAPAPEPAPQSEEPEDGLPF